MVIDETKAAFVPREVSKLLIKRDTDVYADIDAGRLHAKKVKGKWLIQRSDLKAYVERQIEKCAEHARRADVMSAAVSQL